MLRVLVLGIADFPVRRAVVSLCSYHRLLCGSYCVKHKGANSILSSLLGGGAVVSLAALVTAPLLFECHYLFLSLL